MGVKKKEQAEFSKIFTQTTAVAETENKTSRNEDKGMVTLV